MQEQHLVAPRSPGTRTGALAALWRTITAAILTVPPTATTTTPDRAEARSPLRWGRLDLLDCLVLLIVIALNSAPYVFRLGFQLDDWWALGRLRTSEAQSLPALIDVLYTPLTEARPIMVVYLALLYWAYGLSPALYHLTNTAVLAVGVIGFYAVLRALRLPRTVCVLAPMLFAVLPHYSTDRLWLLAAQITLSTTLAFAFLYADLRSIEARSIARVAWKIGALMLLLTSGLSYETGLILFLLSVPITLIHDYRFGNLKVQRLRSFGVYSALLNLVATAGIAVFKMSATHRTHPPSGIQDLVKTVLDIEASAVFNNYWRNLVELPFAVWTSLTTYSRPVEVIAAIVASAVTYYWLRRTLILQDGSSPRWVWYVLVGGGLVLSVGSYLIFVSAPNELHFAKAGIANRVGITAAIGVALVCTGVIRLAGTLGGRRLFAIHLPCALAAGLVFSSVIVNTTVATFFADAYDRQQEIVAAMTPAVQRLPAGSTVLLDDICRWNGPASIFEIYWDTTGRLQVLTGDSTIRGDVIEPALSVTPAGVVRGTLNDGTDSSQRVYAYGDLYVYRVASKQWHQLDSYPAAQRYFTEISPDRGRSCPFGWQGQGVAIFTTPFQR